MSKGIGANVCVYAGCGFRSHDKSPWANEITKTKLQTNTQTRSLHKHAVAGSGASRPNLFCNQTVHRYGLSFTVRFAFIISYHNSSTWLSSVTRSSVSPVTLIRHCHRCKKKVHRAGSFFAVLFTDCISCRAMSKWLFAVTRNQKSRFTQKFFKTKSASCLRCRKVVGLLRTFHGDELSKKSTVTNVNFTLRFVNGNLSRSAWPATFVFLQWCLFEAASCPTKRKGRTKIKLYTNSSRHHCRNILLCAVFSTRILFSICRDI